MPHKDPEARKAYLKKYAEQNPAYARVKAWREQNKEKRAQQQAEYVARHPDVIAQKSKRYRIRHIDKILEQDRQDSAAYRAKNPEKVKASKKRYAQENKEKINAAVAKRNAAKLKQTPAWLTEDDFWLIEQAYDLAKIRSSVFGFKWHVDHILPLKGKTVSGFHAPNNIRVIPWIQNVKKGNRLEASHD
jgi:hypothetical protein